MKKEQLFIILQLAGGTFPTGSFSQSWGLETFVTHGEVSDEEDFRKFLLAYVNTTLAGLEGPFLCSAYDLAASKSLVGLRGLDRQLAAMKLTKESREGCLRTGKALLRIASQITADQILTDYYEGCCGSGSSYPVAFALVSARLGLTKEDALNAFLFSSVNSLVQSGLKLIPLGNIQAQRILLSLYGDIAKAAECAFRTDAEDAFAFCPGLDIASMQHETLQTRLYMS
ncbi:MAG: urease accessory protein UreF [Eubacteriales bacterium]|nr:urease accessory protein UreF [Eubacteriales bacterium]